MAVDKLVDSTQLDADLTSVANAIRAKSGGSGSLAFPADFVSEIGSISTGNPTAEPNDVNFIDYDGTVRYSYSASEFANLTALPANPSHDGLTAQGWNWTLAAAQTYVAAQGILTIGQEYATNDGKTHIFIELTEEFSGKDITININQSVANGTTIDWGDGASEIVESSGSTSISHTYAAEGDYEITLAVDSSCVTKCGHGTEATSFITGGCQNAVKHIFFGARISIYQTGALCSLNRLETVILRNSVGSTQGVITVSCFRYCMHLRCVVIPTSFRYVSGANVFSDCYSLERISVPYNSLSFNGQNLARRAYSLLRVDGGSVGGAAALCDCYSLARIPPVASEASELNYGCKSLIFVKISASLSKIGAQAFSNCSSLQIILFESTTPPTVANSNAWTNVPTTCKIYVPSGTLSDYTSATNYPSSSTYTYVEY